MADWHIGWYYFITQKWPNNKQYKEWTSSAEQTHFLSWLPAFVQQNRENEEQTILQTMNCVNPSSCGSSFSDAVDMVQHYSAAQN